VLLLLVLGVMAAIIGEPVETISLSLTANYAPSWGVWEGLRETVQNWHDGVLEVAGDASVEFIPDGNDCFTVRSQGGECGHLRYHAGERTLVLANRGIRLGRQVLLLGFSQKAKRSDVIGAFGEGLKVGTLALLRRGVAVTLATNDELWDFQLAIDKHFGEKVLTVAVHARPTDFSTNSGDFGQCDMLAGAGDGHPNSLRLALQDLGLDDTATAIQGLRPEEWHELSSRFLFLHPPSNAVATEQGRLLLDDRLKHQFFVRGIWINEDTSLAAGVDFANLRLDRDRAAVLKHSEIEHQMSSMWVRAIHLQPELLPRYFGVLSSEEKTSDVAFAELYCDEDMASSVAAWFVQQHGDVVPIAAKDATSAKMARVRDNLERAAMVCSNQLLAVLKKGGLQCDLETLFAVAASRGKKYIPACALSPDEIACLIHGCAMASTADPKHPVQIAEVDVIEMHGSVVLEAQQLVQPSEAFKETGRFEVNSIALSLDKLHQLLGGCLTPTLGSECRCREAELARAILGARSAAGSACPYGPRRLLAQLAAEACGGAVRHCATTSGACSAPQLAEAREISLRKHITALEEILSAERQAHSVTVADLNGQIKEAMQEITQHEFKVMDIHDSVRKEFGAEIDRWKAVSTSAQATQMKCDQVVGQLAVAHEETCKRSQEVTWLQRRCEASENELAVREEALQRRIAVAMERETALRSALTRRAEMLQALLVQHEQPGSQEAERTVAWRKLCTDLEEERLHVCCVCAVAPPKVVLLPCRHQHLCAVCAPELSRCPICRIPIRERLEVYD